MTQVTLDEARTRLPELVAAAARGEDVVIVRDAQPVVKLVAVPPPPPRPKPQFGSARGLIVMADDFDAPLEDFREYME